MPGGEDDDAAPPGGLRTVEKPSRRARGRRFARGSQAGPGRPRGARSKAQAALDAIGQEHGEAVLRKLVQSALAGDTAAALAILGRCWPPRKDWPVAIALPAVEGAGDLGAAASAIVRAMAGGDLTPTEAGAAVGVLQGAAAVFSVADLAQRVEVLEAAAALGDEGGDR